MPRTWVLQLQGIRTCPCHPVQKLTNRVYTKGKTHPNLSWTFISKKKNSRHNKCLCCSDLTCLLSVMALGWHLVQIPSGHGGCPSQPDLILQLMFSRATNFPLNRGKRTYHPSIYKNRRSSYAEWCATDIRPEHFIRLGALIVAHTTCPRPKCKSGGGV